MSCSVGNYSIIRYDISIWGGTYDTTIDPLKKIQNKILKIILKKYSRYHIKYLYNDMNVLYSRRRENASRWRIQMTELRGFVPKFLPLYHLGAAVNSPTRYAWPAAVTAAATVAATVAAARVDGGQRSGRLGGGNARDRTNFGRRPKAFSRRPEYKNNNLNEFDYRI